MEEFNPHDYLTLASQPPVYPWAIRQVAREMARDARDRRWRELKDQGIPSQRSMQKKQTRDWNSFGVVGSHAPVPCTPDIFCVEY